MISCAAHGGILLRLRGRHTRLEPADHVVAPGTRASGQFVLREAHRHPKLAAVQLAGNQRKLEIAGHDADDLVRFAVEQNLPAQNLLDRREAAAPCLIAEQRHLLRCHRLPVR
jgi:hypothetical protein